MTVVLNGNLYDPTYPGTYSDATKQAVALALDAFVSAVRAAGLHVTLAETTGAVQVRYADLPPT